MQTNITVNKQLVSVRCATCEAEIVAKTEAPMGWDCECNETHLEILNTTDPGPTGEQILAMDKDEREADQLTARLRRAMGKNWRFRIRQSEVDGKWIAEVSDSERSLPFFYFWHYFSALGDDGIKGFGAMRCESRLQAVKLVKKFCIKEGL